MSLPTITTDLTAITTATVANPAEAQNQPSSWSAPATRIDIIKFLLGLVFPFLVGAFLWSYNEYSTKQAQARDVADLKTTVASYAPIKEQRIQQITQLNDNFAHLVETVDKLDKKVDKNDAESKANLRDIQTDIKTLLQRPVR